MIDDECRRLRETILKELAVVELLVELLTAHGLAVKLNAVLIAADHGGLPAAAELLRAA
jgi:hypothetical protein